jgi:hypothetical protein
MAIEIVDWDQHYENNRTRELKQMQWVPMPNRHDGDGYTELLDHPNGSSHFGAWCALVQVASRCDPRGTLLRDSAVPHNEASLARMTRIPIKVWQEALPRLASIGWIRNNEIPQGDATIPHPAAMNGMEWNGRKEGNTIALTRNTVSMPKPVFNFDDKLWDNISNEKVGEWQLAFPACDVELELRRMGEWLLANPTKRKSNYARFIFNWLTKTQDKGGKR